MRTPDEVAGMQPLVTARSFGAIEIGCLTCIASRGGRTPDEAYGIERVGKPAA